MARVPEFPVLCSLCALNVCLMLTSRITFNRHQLMYVTESVPSDFVTIFLCDKDLPTKFLLTGIKDAAWQVCFCGQEQMGNLGLLIRTMPIFLHSVYMLGHQMLGADFNNALCGKSCAGSVCIFANMCYTRVSNIIYFFCWLRSSFHSLRATLSG